MVRAAGSRYDKDMIIVHGVIPIKPSRRDEALTLARVVSAATQAEAGCVSYEFYVGLRDPNTLVLLQEWESMEALSRHFHTEHVRTFMEALPEVLAGHVTTRQYAVQTQPDQAGADQLPPIIH